MPKIVKLLFICCILHTSIGWSQSPSEILHLAESAFEDNNYEVASFYFSKLLNNNGETLEIINVIYPYEFSPSPSKKQTNNSSKNIEPNINPTTSNLLYKLAESYRMSSNYIKAEQTYLKCKSQLKTNNLPLLEYWYATCLKNNMKYEEAIDSFNKFIEQIRSNITLDEINKEFEEKATNEIQSCRYALENIKYPVVGVKIKSTDSTLNQSINNFSAIFSNNESDIIFSSSKNYIGKHTKENPLNSDIFITDNKQTNKTQNLLPFEYTINTSYNEGAPSISKDGNMLMFSRENKNGEINIFVSINFNGQWLKSQKINESVNLPGYNSTHPFISDNGKQLYFSSDRPGGKGGMDIWVCDIDRHGNPSNEINIGNPVNTTGDEVSPHYCDKRNTLFFSSNGHYGMGAFDIYKIVGNIDNFNGLENLGYPINSGNNDLFFSLNKNGNLAYFTSDKSNCKNCTNNNCYNIYSSEYNPITFKINGSIRNAMNDQPIPNAVITIQDKSGIHEPIFISSDNNGDYSTILPRAKNLFIKVQNIGFFADSISISTFENKNSSIQSSSFYLPQISTGEIEMLGIKYSSKQWELDSLSKLELDTMAMFLKFNNNLSLEISSHTDQKGAENYNLKLSQKRAQAVVDYLITKGIQVERLSAYGYGETKPRINSPKTDKEHSENRRTCFEVIREDY